MKTTSYDVLIVGTGAAGLFTALSFKADTKVGLITKTELSKSDSYLAQGGICVLKDPKDRESFLEDTLKAGRYENLREAVEIMVDESPEIIKQLIDYGVEFQRDQQGNLLYTKEGAHSHHRILYHKDLTGKEIVEKLIEQVKKRKNIIVHEDTTFLDLLENNHESRDHFSTKTLLDTGNKIRSCKGILVQNKDHQNQIMLAKTVVLATGGVGGLFTRSTNYRHLTGDGIAIALHHGVELEDMEYVQFHPTSFYSEKPGRRFLISESVRGEGAILLNENKERFVNELLPRDIVANAIRNEMEQSKKKYVYLSFQEMKGIDIKKRFPSIYRYCLEEGYDITKDFIPVTPAQHYLMGGIKVDVNGESSMKNLYAVGETACNGVHGANRLASNSLLESLVFARRAANKIEDEILEEFDENRGFKDKRTFQENRDLQENREFQENRDLQESREFKENRDLQENREFKENRDFKENSENRRTDELLYAEEEMFYQGHVLTEEEKKQLILGEIKRRDEQFYEKWCHESW